MRKLRLRGHGTLPQLPRRVGDIHLTAYFVAFFVFFVAFFFFFVTLFFFFVAFFFFFVTFFFMARHGTLPQLPQLPWSALPSHAERLAVAQKHSVRRARSARQRKVA